MSNISPISGARASIAATARTNATAKAAVGRDFASAAKGVSETSNGERNAAATAAEARRLASSSTQAGVGGALDIRG